MAKQRYTADEVVRAIVQAKGLQVHAADRLGCSQDTIANYAKRYPAVQQALRHARERNLDTAESKLFAAIDAGEPWAICFFLKTQGRARGYVERNEHTGRDGGPIEIKTITVALPALEGTDDDGDGA